MHRLVALLSVATFAISLTFANASPARAADTATHVAVTLTDMSLTASPASAPEGAIVFDVANTGTIEHEFVILKTAIAADAVPARPGHAGQVAEIGHVDEIEGIPAGKTVSLSVTLAPGDYVLFCNLPGHYAGGMRAAFTVTSAIAATEKDNSITLGRSFAIAGPVTFTIANAGSTTHEFVVIKTDVAEGALPASADEPGTVDETGAVGEAEDIAKGTSTSLTLTLAAGKYVIICNMPGHYGLGMHTSLTVLPTEARSVAAARDVQLAALGLEDLADLDARVDTAALLAAPGIVATAADRAAIAAGYVPQGVATGGTLEY